MMTASAIEVLGEASADVPVCRTLPVTDRLFRQAARDIALIGDGLLLLHDAPLLAVSLPSDGWQTPWPLVVWDDALAPCDARARAICETELTGPALEALCLAADALHARLSAWQWTDADVHGLCALTDGTGLVLGRIRDFGAGLLHAAPRATPVLPMAPDGLWPLLAGAGNAMRH